MTLHKLFKVLVVGGAALAGCDDEVGDTRGPLLDVDAAIPADASPDGVSGWLSWWEDMDAGAPDAGAPDAAPLPDAGVSGWLSWV
jgi:hypothetical protein